jgi:hypothetical protein
MTTAKTDENRCRNLHVREGLPPAERAQVIHGLMPAAGLFEGVEWRISPDPYPCSRELTARLQTLGGYLHAFNRAANQLWLRSKKGQSPSWIADYLDRGKPPALTDFARMNRFKNDLPRVIRPDIIPTDHGIVVTELDSVPGGIGLTGWLGQAYGSIGFPVLGGPCGMIKEFARMMRAAAGKDNPAIAILVSEEAATYRPEMTWLAAGLREEEGLTAFCIEPKQILFHEDGLAVLDQDREVRIDVVYRFFELFDLKNIPKAELVMYAARKGTVVVTPPYKPYLEEKMWMALFQHPLLQEYWKTELSAECYAELRQVFPATWILDHRPLPPYGVVPGFLFRGRPLHDWRELADASQKERELIVKISGFSQHAWGSRGVVFGQDVPGDEWNQALEHALQSFPEHPNILQVFHRARQQPVEYYDFARNEVRVMPGRARLCPYYFVSGDEPRLGGVLATVCPADKKILHGMPDAIMAPCVERE